MLITKFCYGFPVDILLLVRGLIVQTIVQSPGIVEALDEGEDIPPGRSWVVEQGALEQLAFQPGEEGLGHGVVVAVADRAHRGQNAGLLASKAEFNGGVLTALVGVVDDAGGPTTGQRHVERGHDQAGAHVGVHGPAHDLRPVVAR